MPAGDQPSTPDSRNPHARELDVRGLYCPLPILRTRVLLDTMADGEELVVLVTDPASVIDFKHFCNVTANELLAHEQRGDVFVYRIRRRV